MFEKWKNIIKQYLYIYQFHGETLSIAKCDITMLHSHQRRYKICGKFDPPPPSPLPNPPILSNVHVLRPSEPEKMVFANVSVCLYDVDLYFVSTITFEKIDRLDWPLVHFLMSKNEGQVR